MGAQMKTATVYAVMKVTIEVPVRSSSANETMEQLLNASQREAEGILRNKLDPAFCISGPVAFSHAIVREQE